MVSWFPHLRISEVHFIWIFRRPLFFDKNFATFISYTFVRVLVNLASVTLFVFKWTFPAVSPFYNFRWLLTNIGKICLNGLRVSSTKHSLISKLGRTHLRDLRHWLHTVLLIIRLYRIAYFSIVIISRRCMPVALWSELWCYVLHPFHNLSEEPSDINIDCGFRGFPSNRVQSYHLFLVEKVLQLGDGVYSKHLFSLAKKYYLFSYKWPFFN